MEIRLNKFLATAGIASRRKCDEHISSGKVKVNGKIVTKLGIKVDPENDSIEFENTLINIIQKKIYILLNKPTAVVTTVKDELNRNTVLDLIPISERIYPVGRLDYESSGALLLTNDGNLSHRLAHPSYEVNKIYHVLLDRVISAKDLYHFEHGILLDNKKTYPCKASQIRVYDNCSLLSINIHEGRNRQIRKMFEAIGYEVQELNRVVFANLDLHGLKQGEWRYLTKKELAEIKLLVNYEN
ncbi:pseudouridine synthase [Calditrichota bacterium]